MDSQLLHSSRGKEVRPIIPPALFLRTPFGAAHVPYQMPEACVRSLFVVETTLMAALMPSHVPAWATVTPGYYGHTGGYRRPNMYRSGHLGACLQVSYDLLDTYPGGPYKSRGGSIKKTRFVEEEEEDEDDDDDDQDQVQPSALPP